MHELYILRIGHRPERDQRVTTHVGLAARAFGAKGMYLAADDPGVKRSVEDVAHRWGGDFFVENNSSWRRCIYDFKRKGGAVVHLTMYGERMTDVIGEIRAESRLLIVVGAEKVPGELYGLADYNVSVTTQPHSEISSLAVFMDHIYGGSELNREYPDAEMKIHPLKHGKKKRMDR
jgi:tRNA (cytidine56-2'-O)-methyltransferase